MKVFIFLKKPLFIFSIVGFLLRLFVAGFDYRGDVNNHIAWGQDVVKRGAGGFYERDYFPKQYGNANPNYPPLAIVAFGLSYQLYESTKGATFWLNEHVGFFPSNLIFIFDNPKVLPAFMKLPAIFADIGIAYLMYLFAIAITKNKSRSLAAAALALFNPAFFYNSAWWGQIEALPLFFLLASLYVLLYRKKYTISAFLFAAALLSKQTTVIFIPLILIVIYRLCGRKNLITWIGTGLVFFWVMFLPFYKIGPLLTYPFITYWKKIVLIAGLPYISNHAFNAWYLVGGGALIKDTNLFLLGLSYHAWGQIIVTAILLTIIYYLLAHKNFKIEKIFFSFALIGLATFLFLTKMHERHLQQVLPFFLILTFYNRRRLSIYAIVCAVSFFNLYDGWLSPQLPLMGQIISLSVVHNVMAMALLVIFFSDTIVYIRKK